MSDMWMLSVAAELVNRGARDSAALGRLEELVRTVPALSEALDAARVGADGHQLGEALAAGLGAAHEESEDFADQLEALWPEVLFGPKPARPKANNTVIGDVNGRVIQADTIHGGISLFTEKPAAPEPAAPIPEPVPAQAPEPRRPRFSFRRTKNS
ncbi:hypothetical protein [Kutzneria sp. 744]|uniref:hypothetical protein n=1 Tax=Kutzneria sp. (strain 744) TaxID=345341 RepID=UPI0003EEC7EF|nr:hypothetical protein [Kutzneria sp. 744]EWM11096.1 hypothetical protein KUTG_01400 [Kutzneria sp. 744]